MTAPVVRWALVLAFLAGCETGMFLSWALA